MWMWQRDGCNGLPQLVEETHVEKWKVVKNFEAYEVSDLGKVRRRLPGKSNRALEGRISAKGV